MNHIWSTKTPSTPGLFWHCHVPENGTYPVFSLFNLQFPHGQKKLKALGFHVRGWFNLPKSGLWAHCNHPPLTHNLQPLTRGSAELTSYETFSRLCLGTRFQYDERTHGPQNQVWVKIGYNEIAEWDPENIATNWVGQQICSFADSDEHVAELVFIVRDESDRQDH